MIIGCGVDILRIERMEKMLEKESFLLRFFTEYERNYVQSKRNKAQTAAGIFCAKEAVLKALKKGIGTIDLKNIEVRHEIGGAPTIKVAQLDTIIFHASISHEGENAIAFVIAEQ